VDEGVYLVYIRRPGPPPHVSILKFTIDRTPPVLSLRPLNQLGGGVRPALGRAFTAYTASSADQSGLVLTRPGRLRLGAVDPLSGVDRIDYQLDGAALTTYSDDTSFVRTLTVDQVGTHTISLRATDAAGNVAVANGLTFDVVDTATPSPSPSASPSPTPTPTRRPTPTPAPTPVPTPILTPTPPPPFTISASVTPTSQTTTACPFTFSFSATITYTGTTPITLQYVWLRSDGAIQTQPFTVVFRGPGTQQLQGTTWQLSSNGNQTFNGWEQVQLASSPVVLSNRANFSLTCIVIG